MSHRCLLCCMLCVMKRVTDPCRIPSRKQHYCTVEMKLKVQDFLVQGVCHIPRINLRNNELCKAGKLLDIHVGFAGRGLEERFTCGSRIFSCIVCQRCLCRKDSLMRHLTRNAGRNPCSKVLDDAQIGYDAVAARRVSRSELGTDRQIEAALNSYKKLTRCDKE
jgi:hypothetical protein